MANYQSRYTGPEIDERLRKAGEAVLTEAQSLDTEKQAQARENIGAASSAAVDGKYTKPSGGIPASDLASGVQASLGKADTAYQKPQAGIPSDDIAPGVIPDVSQFITDDDLSAALEAKQDTISDLADIRSGSQNNVKYTQQTLTDAQKEQARTNIGADALVIETEYVDLGEYTTTTTYQEVRDAVAAGKKIYVSILGGFSVIEVNGGMGDLDDAKYDLVGCLLLKEESDRGIGGIILRATFYSNGAASEIHLDMLEFVGATPDWNAGEGEAGFIKHKPEIPTVESMTAQEVTAAVDTAWNNVMS